MTAEDKNSVCLGRISHKGKSSEKNCTFAFFGINENEAE